jgi:hypothetical protein
MAAHQRANLCQRSDMMRRTRQASRAVLAALVGGSVAACGSSSGGGAPTSPAAVGSATVNGTLNGQPIAAADVIGMVGTEMEEGVPSAYAAVAISNTTGTCQLAEEREVEEGPVGSALLILDVITPGNAVVPGTYSVGSTGLAQYQTIEADGSRGYAGSGTVTFDTITATAMAGSFAVDLAGDLDAGGNAHLTGTFSGPICAGALAPFVLRSGITPVQP